VAEAENSGERLRGLAASLAGGRKGGGGGRQGVFIGRARGRNGQALIGIRRGGNALGSFRMRRPEVDDGLTRRSHLSVGSTCQWKRERARVPIRDFGVSGPRAERWTGPVRFPLAFLFIFLSFFFFLFLFSYFFPTFCILDPN
jgi:hypothetical protein